MQLKNVVFAVSVVSALTAVSGCADQTVKQPTGGGVTMPATPPAWHEPTAYKFTLKSSCGALEGTFQNVVQEGSMVQNTGLDEAARKALSAKLSKLVPTLGQIEAQVATARAQGDDEVLIDHDATDGHPTSARIDPKKDAKGDERCYAVSDYSVG